jgi:hypothetical protein
MKTMRMLMACVAMAAVPAAAQKECTRADAAAAEKAIDKVVNYATLGKAWKDYRHCDTGSVGESFTDAILRIMVEWKNVDTIVQDMQADPEYKKFIHKHLLSPAAKDDRGSVYSRAKSNCPLTQGAFCAELMDVLKETRADKADLLAPIPVANPTPAPPKK